MRRCLCAHTSGGARVAAQASANFGVCLSRKASDKTIEGFLVNTTVYSDQPSSCHSAASRHASASLGPCPRRLWHPMRSSCMPRRVDCWPGIMHQPLTADASERATVVGKIKTQRLLAHACSRRWLIGNFEPVPAKKSDKNRWTVNRRNAPWQNHRVRRCA